MSAPPIDNRRPGLQLLKQGWTILICAALAAYLWRHGSLILASLQATPWSALALSLLCILGGKLAAFFVMTNCLAVVDQKRADLRSLLWVYSSADVAKYLPGGVWGVIGRVIHYRHAGMSPVVISKALLLEHVGLGFTALLFGFPIGVHLLTAHWQSGMAFVTVLAGGALALVIIGIGLMLRGDDLRRLLLALIRTWPAMAAMLAGWALLGTSFFVLMPGALNWSDWLWISSAHALAFLGGMIAVFAPAGVGVREGLMVLVGQLQGIPAMTMLNVALLSRALWVLADSTLFVVAFLAGGRKR